MTTLTDLTSATSVDSYNDLILIRQSGTDRSVTPSLLGSTVTQKFTYLKGGGIDSIAAVVADGDVTPAVGDIFEVNYYDNNNISGSGARWRCVSISSTDVTAEIADESLGASNDIEIHYPDTAYYSFYIATNSSATNFYKFEPVDSTLVHPKIFGAIDDGIVNDSVAITTTENFIEANFGIAQHTLSAKLHIRSEDADASAPTTDTFVVEGDGEVVGMTLLGDTAFDINIDFGNSVDNVAAQIQYDHANLEFSIGTQITGGDTVIYSGNGVEAVRIDDSQNTNFTGNITLSGTVDGRDLAADGQTLDNTPNTPTLQGTNVTASAGDFIVCTSNITVTLPSSPTAGDMIRIKDATGDADTNNITVARNGSNIVGVAEDFVIDTNWLEFTFIYIDGTTGWTV